METRKYIRKPLVVEGVRVTKENFAEVAMWCSGCIKWSHDASKLSTVENPTNGTIDPSAGVDPIDPENQFIEVEVINPHNTRQTRAFVGDWVLKSETGQKIYTDRAFCNSFDSFDYEMIGPSSGLNPGQMTTESEKED